MILNFPDEVDGGDAQKKQLTNPHVELRKYEIKCCWFRPRDYSWANSIIWGFQLYPREVFCSLNIKSVCWCSFN